jgi:poly(hydroxyalkanoate) depolymerase family esterase
VNAYPHFASRRLLVALALAAIPACAPLSDGEIDGTADRTASAASSGGLTEVTSFGSNPGQLKMFEHVPANLPANAPLLVVLHGCTEHAADIAQTGWNELADANGFAVVYPEQQSSNNGVLCFSWSAGMGSVDDVTRGKGENESIRQMVDKAAADHHTDPKRVFAAGFSAGAAMAVVLAATWPDVFAGVASFAGIPYGCAQSLVDVSSCMNPGEDHTAADWGSRVHQAFQQYSGPWPRMAFWQGSSDGTVGPKNRTELLRQWTNIHGLPETATATDTVDGSSHGVWKDDSGAIVIETFEVPGMGHGVPVKPSEGCGHTGQYAFDKGICGARRVAAFFGLAPATPPH